MSEAAAAISVIYVQLVVAVGAVMCSIDMCDVRWWPPSNSLVILRSVLCCSTTVAFCLFV